MSYEPIPMFQDRAIAWLLESVENMQALIEIVVPEIAKDLDGSSLRMIESSLVDKDLRKIEEDMVYEAQLRNDQKASLSFVIVIAHQSKKDSTLSFRILNAMTKLWERELRKQAEDRVSAPRRRLRPIVPIVISTYEKPWAVPRLRELVLHHPTLTPFVPDFKMAILDLAATPRAEILRHQRPLASLLSLFQAERVEQGFEARLSLKFRVRHKIL